MLGKVIIIEDLVIRAKSGDKDAYSKLIESVKGDLCRIARSRINNESDSQDIVQDTVIKAYFNLRKLRNNKNFKSWIIKILINECNKFYRKSKRRDEIFNKYSVDAHSVTYMDDAIDLDNIMKVLNEKEKKIFELYVDGYSIKQISKKLGINENTVKTNLRRSRVKLRKTYSPASIFMFILCVLIVTSVTAVSIISYIKSLFELDSIGKDNSGILMAIENMDWYQKVDMNYIDLGDGYKIKMEYLLMDEMNLYMVFDFTSEKDISKFIDVTPTNLRIVNENGNVICNRDNIFEEQCTKMFGYKLIDSNKNNMKVLVYMYTDNFPMSKTLDINFTGVDLTKKLKHKLSLTTNVNFKVDLIDKFANRTHNTYASNDAKVEKAIVTESGLYAIINVDDKNIDNLKLFDSYGNLYPCCSYSLSYPDKVGVFKYIIISNFNSTEITDFKLIVNSNEFNLTKEK